MNVTVAIRGRNANLNALIAKLERRLVEIPITETHGSHLERTAMTNDDPTNDVRNAFLAALVNLVRAQFGDDAQLTINYRHGSIVGMQITPLESSDPSQAELSPPEPGTAHNER